MHQEIFFWALCLGWAAIIVSAMLMYFQGDRSDRTFNIAFGGSVLIWVAVILSFIFP